MLKPDYHRGPYRRPFDTLLKKGKNLVGAEVGVYRGQHVREMLEMLDIKKLYLVDPWENYEEYSDYKKGEQMEEAYQDAKQLLKEHREKLVWIKKYSVEGVKLVPDKSLDFVYIDGNHDYEFVKQDIEAWMPKLKMGGFIGGHDYLLKAFPGVVKAVNEYCKKYSIKFQTKEGNVFPYYVGTGNTDWAFKKSGTIKNWEFAVED